MRKRWWIVWAAVGGAFVSCAGLSQLYHSYPEVTIVNDLEFEVALSQCERSSVWHTDPVFISPGRGKGVHAGPNCVVNGPTNKFGPFGAAKGEGPYIGCLVIPPESERDDAAVRISSAKAGVSCD